MQANSVYQHHTLGLNIRVVVTEIVLLDKDDVSFVYIFIYQPLLTPCQIFKGKNYYWSLLSCTSFHSREESEYSECNQWALKWSQTETQGYYLAVFNSKNEYWPRRTPTALSNSSVSGPCTACRQCTRPSTTSPSCWPGKAWGRQVRTNCSGYLWYLWES